MYEGTSLAPAGWLYKMTSGEAARPLAGKRIVLVGAGIFEKLGGGARIGGLVDILRAQGAQVTLVSFLPYGKKFRIETQRAHGVTSHNITFPARWPRNLKGAILIVHNFLRIWREALRADVVWTSCGQMPPNAVSILAARLARTPVVYDYLDLEVHMKEKPFVWFLRRCTAVFACSHYLAEKARGYGAKDVVYMPCFVDLEKFKPNEEGRREFRKRLGVADDEVLLGYAGVLHTQEGVHVLVEALSKLHPRHPELKLAVLGVSVPTEVMDDVPALIEKFGLQGVAQAVPPVVHSEVPKFLSACDILVTPKLETPVNSATIAIKLVEYMAMERPTVACSVGEVKRIVTDGVDGYVARPGDPDDVARRIEDVLADEARARRIAAAARQRVSKEFSSEAVGRTIAQAVARLGGGK